MVILRPHGPGADNLTGGVLSYLQAQDAGRWTDLYQLFSPLPGSAEPSYKLSDNETEMTVVPAVAISGPVRIVVPPVTVGTYRVRREFFDRRRSGPVTELMLDALIEVIP